MRFSKDPTGCEEPQQQGKKSPSQLRQGSSLVIVIAFYDGFVLYVPKGTTVDEVLLRRAIKGRSEDAINKESNTELAGRDT